MTATRAEYDQAFARECAQTYPRIEEYEAQCGFAIGQKRLESAARSLACPVKVNPPNWQHGRVIYATLRSYIGRGLVQKKFVHALDIGTAKGFSALCARFAMIDAGCDGIVTSLDVIDPYARVSRNTVAECDGLLTLAQTIEPWHKEAMKVFFVKSQSVDWLTTNRQPIGFAFVDGKHNRSVVEQEISYISKFQREGDIVLFDDAHMPHIKFAIEGALRYGYLIKFLEAKPDRAYAIAVKQ